TAEGRSHVVRRIGCGELGGARRGRVPPGRHPPGRGSEETAEGAGRSGRPLLRRSPVRGRRCVRRPAPPDDCGRRAPRPPDAARTTLLQDLAGQVALSFAVPPSVAAAACDAPTPEMIPDGAMLVLEKPFGTNQESALALNARLPQLVPEKQVFRVDHFLG